MKEYSDEESDLDLRFNPVFGKFLNDHDYTMGDWYDGSQRAPGSPLYELARKHFGDLDEYGWPRKGGA